MSLFVRSLDASAPTSDVVGFADNTHDIILSTEGLEQLSYGRCRWKEVKV